MRLVIFGATGGIGREVVSQALDQGHEVVAIARNPDGVGRAHERLRLVKADILDASTYDRELAGASAVIGTLGARSRPKGPISLCTDWAKHLIPAMQAQGVSRLVAVTAGAYVRASPPPLFFRLVLQPILLSVLRHLYDDHQRMEEVVAASPLRWTIVRPSRLLDRPRTGTYRTAIDDLVTGSMSIPRADVADFMLKCAVGDSHVRERVSVST
ncbi:MAG TPA: SDR family oxidoreductase [Myxococcaceae bacterium]